MNGVATEPIARRGEQLGRVLPAPAVVVATLVALVAASGSDVSATRVGVGLAVVGGALVWSLALVLRLDRLGRTARVVTVAGQYAFAATLAGVSGWFGIYAFTGYLVVDFLPRRAQRPAVVLNAVIVSAAQIGGYPSDATGLVLWAGVAAVNVALVLTFVSLSERMAEQNEQLAAALVENAGLHEQLVAQAREAGVLDERQRLAGELHDTLAQGLIGIVTQLEAAEQARHLPERWQHHVAQARDLARRNLVDARRSVTALRPEQLERRDLPGALTELVDRWDAPARIAFDTTGTTRTLPADVEDALFRVAQESLANCARHAGAGKVAVTVSFLDDRDGTVLLDIRDDGVGFDPAAHTAGYGLQGMRERMARVGGRVEVESVPGDGVAVSAAVTTDRAARP